MHDTEPIDHGVGTDRYVKDPRERRALIANIEKFAKKVGCKPDYVNWELVRYRLRRSIPAACPQC